MLGAKPAQARLRWSCAARASLAAVEAEVLNRTDRSSPMAGEAEVKYLDGDFRVVRPGNTVGLVAWVPDGVAAELFAIGRRHAPPTSTRVTPHEQWGDEDVVRERLGGLANSIEM